MVTSRKPVLQQQHPQAGSHRLLSLEGPSGLWRGRGQWRQARSSKQQLRRRQVASPKLALVTAANGRSLQVMPQLSLSHSLELPQGWGPRQWLSRRPL